MAQKVQTISEIRSLISGMLRRLLPAEEAEALASSIIREYTGMTRAAQLAFGDRQPEKDATEKILAAAGRASEGEPMQYITGYTEFCGHRIEVEPGVLIPRPETEEMALMIIAGNQGFEGTVTDFCTGSGCIAIALSLAFPRATVVATDNSPAATRVAERNFSLTGASVTLVMADLFTDDHAAIPMCDIIVSNPPYVTESEKTAMHPNVLDHEPHEALFVPDNDPLLYYRRIAEIAALRLASGGTVWLEVNENHARSTAGLFSSGLYSQVSILKDIRGKERFIKAERHG
ncbi:MAG: peptide chain release factor N(5)-glutamine methyltransferase [Bacteroidales bacterium]|nr:peptide chain release factor N(5)-glutamine methyltransferase [Bacteroidales bacterium]